MIIFTTHLSFYYSTLYFKEFVLSYLWRKQQDFHMIWFCLCLWFLVGEFRMFFMSLVLSATCPLYNYIEAQLPAALVDIGDIILIRITNFLKKSVVWSSNELQFYLKSPQ